MPRIELSFDASAAFEGLNKKRDELPVYSGELYVEIHRGTYTSQAAIKRGNRVMENMLHSVEMLASLAYFTHASNIYPAAAIELSWKNVALNQFHDSLPGSQIHAAMAEAISLYQQEYDKLEKLLQIAGRQLLHGDIVNEFWRAELPLTPALTYEEVIKENLHSKLSWPKLHLPANHQQVTSVTVFNTLGWEVNEIIKLPINPATAQLLPGCIHIQPSQQNPNVTYAQLVVPSVGSKTIPINNPSNTRAQPLATVTVNYLDKSNLYILENNYVKVVVDGQSAEIVSLFDKAEARELCEAKQGLNQFILYDDVPLYWDNWDIELYYKQKPLKTKFHVETIEITEAGPLICSIHYSIQLTRTSTLKQTLSLTALNSVLTFSTSLFWLENHQLLRVEFPLNLHSLNCCYEIQYGLVERPAHSNTSRDLAQFEVCAQRFANLQEGAESYGVALFNDSKHGHSCHKGRLGLSLIRAGKKPDPTADLGYHQFSYALYPHNKGIQQSSTVQLARQFNDKPLILLNCNANEMKSVNECVDKSYFSVFSGSATVILDWMKRAEDSDDLILRCYEAIGARYSKCHIEFDVSSGFQQAVLCNLLEEEREEASLPLEKVSGEKIRIYFDINPFQVLTLKLKR
jgi:alpha-mannosidase